MEETKKTQDLINERFLELINKLEANHSDIEKRIDIIETMIKEDNKPKCTINYCNWNDDTEDNGCACHVKLTNCRQFNNENRG